MDVMLAVVKKGSGETVGFVPLRAWTFKTGRRGFFGVGKLEVDGVRYQGLMQIVRIGPVEAEAEAQAEK